MKDDNRVDVLVLAPHWHFGEQKQKGDVINVTASQAGWLIEHGVAMRQSDAKQTKKEVKE